MISRTVEYRHQETDFESVEPGVRLPERRDRKAVQGRVGRCEVDEVVVAVEEPGQRPKSSATAVVSRASIFVSLEGGIYAVKIYNLFAKKKINPRIGATGLSAVPMASRVANEIALKHDPSNHLLQYAMASNISGVIGSAVAAGVLISFLG